MAPQPTKPPQENNPAQPLGWLKPLPAKLKAINSELESNTDIGRWEVECRTHSGKWRRGKEPFLTAELSCQGCGNELSPQRWTLIKDKRGILTSQSRGEGGFQSWYLGQRAALKTELPHLAGGGADLSDLQLKNAPAAVCWKQLWPHCLRWQSYLTSQLKLILWT
jgi:hypothetical protein